jgi:ferredoxin
VFVLKQIIEKKSPYAKRVEIKALFKDMCNGCMKCVEICPGECISVEF